MNGFEPGMILTVPLLLWLGVRAIHTVGAQPAQGPTTAGRSQPAQPAPQAGWLYFVAGQQGPVRVGCQEAKPTGSAVSAGSPFPLKIIYQQPVANRVLARAEADIALEEYREHGDWYDRDATYYYIDHLRGLV